MVSGDENVSRSEKLTLSATASVDCFFRSTGTPRVCDRGVAADPKQMGASAALARNIRASSSNSRWPFKNNPPKQWPLVFPVCLALIPCLLISCGKPKEEEAPVRTVYVTTVGGAAGAQGRSFSGIAQAEKEIAMSFRVGGQIVELHAEVGQKIKPGDVVAKLDPKDAELEVSQREASLADADAKLQRAKADYERIRQLYEAGSSSAAELDSALASFRSAQANREAVEKDLGLSRQQLKYTTLVSEVTGEITAVPAEVFETVRPGQLIAQVVAGDKIKVEIGIPEGLINAVRPQMPGHIRFDAFPDETFEAKVTEIGRSPTETTTYPVTLILEKQDPRIHPGMVGEANLAFEVQKKTGGIVIPAASVVGEGEERHVWVYDKKTGTVQKRKVRVGALVSAGIKIEEGLANGDQVVTRGVHRVSEGMKVKPIEEK